MSHKPITLISINIAGVVNDVKSAVLGYPVTGGGLPGLTVEETAIVAGVLSGLAALLFLLLPILCCLCPLALCCPCCFGKGQGTKGAAAAGGHKNGNLRRSGSYGTDVESFWSKGSWDKMDYENLYGV
ncbi:hypothetical protein CHS0354_008455 [Potamilus streckersoni]|uniref:Uncharacterized protein n=1 Tax=Potamilus streckersoni TaxID=2493646 RepID=A0AAE0RPJ3_9BIVA|nr:hypothetical protein CHS0354_008455 [Potamilus streckersoni]